MDFSYVQFRISMKKESLPHTILNMTMNMIIKWRIETETIQNDIFLYRK